MRWALRWPVLLRRSPQQSLLCLENRVRWQAHQAATAVEKEASAVWNDARKAEVETAMVASAPAFGRGVARAIASSFDAWIAKWIEARDGACHDTRITRERSDAELEQSVACLDRQLKDVDLLALRLSRADGPGVARASDAAREALPNISRCDDPSAPVIPAEGSQDRVIYDSVVSQLAEARAALLVADSTAALAASTRAVARAAELGDPALSAEAHLVRARVERDAGHLTVAEKLAEQAIALAERARDDVGTAHAWIALASIVGAEADWDRAAKSTHFARAAADRAALAGDARADLFERSKG